MKNPFLNIESAYLRAVEPHDAEIVAQCNNDPEVRASFFTHTPVSITAQADRIRSFYGPGSDYIPFVICMKDNDAAIGMTALHRLDLVSGAAVFSICIADTAHRGKGLARQITEAMLKYSFDVLNLHRIQLHVWVDNAAAVRVYEKCGFVREGVLREAMKHDGKYCDFAVMGILEHEWRARATVAG